MRDTRTSPHARRGLVLSLVAVTALLLSACGDDDDSEPAGFLDQWSDVPAGPALEGEPTRVDEDEEVLYVENCDVAREATATDGAYGPSDGEAGYAFICDE